MEKQQEKKDGSEKRKRGVIALVIFCWENRFYILSYIQESVKYVKTCTRGKKKNAITGASGKRKGEISRGVQTRTERRNARESVVCTK